MTLQDLLRLAQSGARGFTTGLLGAPVDIANTMLGGVGGPKPVMGGEWIGDKLQGMGLLAPPAEDLPNAAAEFAGGLLNPGGGAAVAGKAAAGAKGLLGGGSLAHIVFHGSPHTFDKFDMSKIGTGEGAQAYGHGLYFADSPGVAKSYKDKLSKNEVLLDGQKVKHDRSLLDPQSMGLNALQMEPSPEAAATALRRAVADESLWQRGSQYDHREKYSAAADWLEKNANRIKVDSGNLYKVDIPDEAIGKMLDWDKPLSEQPQAVKDLVASRPDVAKKLSFQQSFLSREPTGQAIYVALGGGPQLPQAAEASALLKEAGIPGLRYLDAGSRDAKSGTYNTVLFDDSLAKILDRQ